MNDLTYVYIAGRYSSIPGFEGDCEWSTTGKEGHDAYHEIDVNISHAREAAAFLANNGIPYFCPHLNSAHFEVITPDVPQAFWLDLGMRLLRGASAALYLAGWMSSVGALREYEEAMSLGIPQFMPWRREALVRWWKGGGDAKV